MQQLLELSSFSFKNQSLSNNLYETSQDPPLQLKLPHSASSLCSLSQPCVTDLERPLTILFVNSFVS